MLTTAAPQIIRGDALAVPLADDSVDLVVTSPPYFALRSYEDEGQHYEGQVGAEASPQEYLDALLAATAEMVRVLRPAGSIFVNLGDKYSDRAGPSWRGSSDRLTGRPDKPRRASSTSMAPRKSLLGLPWRYALRCIDELGLLLRQDLIWSKPNGLPESITDRCRRSHEVWFHFTQGPHYFADVDQLRQDHAASTVRRVAPHRAQGGRRGKEAYGDTAPPQTLRLDQAMHPLGSLPGSVWSIPTQPLSVPPELGIDHFAAFPMEWPRRLIRGWCPPAGVVLDPFGGTGTTALVAHALGRRGISLDLSADYCRLAAWRTTDPGQLAAARQGPKPLTPPAGTAALFELTETTQETPC